jgi:hypothetical protein
MAKIKVLKRSEKKEESRESMESMESRENRAKIIHATVCVLRGFCVETV